MPWTGLLYTLAALNLETFSTLCEDFHKFTEFNMWRENSWLSWDEKWLKWCQKLEELYFCLFIYWKKLFLVMTVCQLCNGLKSPLHANKRFLTDVFTCCLWLKFNYHPQCCTVFMYNYIEGIVLNCGYILQWQWNKWKAHKGQWTWVLVLRRRQMAICSVKSGF